MNSSLQWVLQTITVVALGVVSYFIKEMKKGMDDKALENKKEINALRNDLEDFKEKVSDKYVMKEDFVRAMTTVDKRFDSVDEKLDRIIYSIGTERK